MIFIIIGVIAVIWTVLFLWFCHLYNRGFERLDEKYMRHLDRIKSIIIRLERRMEILEEKMEGNE